MPRTLNEAQFNTFDEIFKKPFVYEWVINTQLLIYGLDKPYLDYVYDYQLALFMKKLQKEKITVNSNLDNAFRNTLRDSVIEGLNENNIKLVLRLKLYQAIVNGNLNSDIQITIRKVLFISKILEKINKKHRKIIDKIKLENDYKIRKIESDKKYDRQLQTFINEATKKAFNLNLTTAVKFILNECPTRTLDPYICSLSGNIKKLKDLGEQAIDELLEEFCTPVDINAYLSAAIGFMVVCLALAKYFQFTNNTSQNILLSIILLTSLIKFRIYGEMMHTVDKPAVFNKDMHDIKNQLGNLQHLSKVKLKDKVFYTPILRGANGSGDYIYEKHEPEIVSARRFLLNYGFTKSQYDSMQSVNKEQVNAGAKKIDQPVKESFSWCDIDFPVDKVKVVQNCPNTYFYFDEAGVRDQMASDGIPKSDIDILINRFKFIAQVPKFCGKVDKHGLKDIPTRPITVTLNNANIASEITHEMKVAGPDRVLCCAIKDSENRGTLYIGYWYIKKGLHTKQAVLSYLISNPNLPILIENAGSSLSNKKS